MDPVLSEDDKKLLAKFEWDNAQLQIIQMELEGAIGSGNYKAWKPQSFNLTYFHNQEIIKRSKLLLNNINQKNIGLSYPEYIHNLEGKVMNCAGKVNQVLWNLKQINHIDISNLDESVNQHIIRSLGGVQISISTRSKIAQAVRNDIADQWIQCKNYIIDMELFTFLKTDKEGIYQTWDSKSCSSFFALELVQERTHRYIKVINNNNNEICEYPECISELEEKIKRCVHDVRDIVWDLKQISSEYDSKKHVPASVDLFINRRIDLCLEYHNIQIRSITRSMIGVAVWMHLDKISNNNPTSTTTSAFTTTTTTTTTAAAAAAASGITTTTTITPNPTSTGISLAVTLPVAQQGILVSPETAVLPQRSNAPGALPNKKEGGNPSTPKRVKRTKSNYTDDTNKRTKSSSTDGTDTTEDADWNNFKRWYGDKHGEAGEVVVNACLEEIASPTTTTKERNQLHKLLVDVNKGAPKHPDFQPNGCSSTCQLLNDMKPEIKQRLVDEVKLYGLKMWLLNQIATQYAGFGFALVTKTSREIHHGDYKRFVNPKSRKSSTSNSLQIPIFYSNNKEDALIMEEAFIKFVGPHWTSLNMNHTFDTKSLGLGKASECHPYYVLMICLHYDVVAKLNSGHLEFKKQALLSTQPKYVLSTEEPPTNAKKLLEMNVKLLKDRAKQMKIQDDVPWNLLYRVFSREELLGLGLQNRRILSLKTIIPLFNVDDPEDTSAIKAVTSNEDILDGLFAWYKQHNAFRLRTPLKNGRQFANMTQLLCTYSSEDIPLCTKHQEYKCLCQEHYFVQYGNHTICSHEDCEEEPYQNVHMPPHILKLQLCRCHLKQQLHPEVAKVYFCNYDDKCTKLVGGGIWGKMCVHHYWLDRSEKKAANPDNAVWVDDKNGRDITVTLAISENFNQTPEEGDMHLRMLVRGAVKQQKFNNMSAIQVAKHIKEQIDKENPRRRFLREDMLTGNWDEMEEDFVLYKIKNQIHHHRDRSGSF